MTVNTYNISNEIFDYVIQFQNGKNPIGFLATGGGFDYVHTEMDGCDVNLSAITQDGSPEKLSEPCNVTIWFDIDWRQGLNIRFPDTKGAINFMVNINQGITEWYFIKPSKGGSFENTSGLRILRNS